MRICSRSHLLYLNSSDETPMITPITTECNDTVTSLDFSSDHCYTYSMKVRDGQSLTDTPFLYSNCITLMLQQTDQQLAMNLCYLLPEDSDLLNDIILEYVELISNTNRSNDLLEFTNNEMRSIV